MQKEKQKQKVINRNHWMFRLYRYCWDSEFHYKGYCPLFWITWFTIFIFPLLWLGRIVVGIFGWINDLIPEKVENPNWLTKVYPYPSVKKQQLNAKRKEKLDQKMEKLVGYLQYLVKPFLVVIAFLFACSIYNLIELTIKNITWVIVKNLGLGLLLGGGILLLVWGGCKIGKWCYDNFKNRKREELGYFNKCEPNRFLATIEEGFTFLKNTIQIVYYRQCPLIVLTDDETRPIEKIKSEK